MTNPQDEAVPYDEDEEEKSVGGAGVGVGGGGKTAGIEFGIDFREAVAQAAGMEEQR